ncbi:MAG: hypothetical protein FJZ96_02755 [Chloroflexi bacterium]|nr:hypothetical protein [Chloroflexota bacterium]
MSILDQLACSLGRRDEVPNQELARWIVAADDRDGVREVAENLRNRDKNIQSDCIKVLYKVGYLKPELAAPFALDFLKLLKSRENRLVWGGMIALSTVAALAADELFPRWEEIRRAMDSGSVITRDGGVLTLAGIASTSQERGAAIFPYLLGHLRTCRPKDVPQHCEKILQAVNAGDKSEFIAVLEERLEDLQGTQVKRVQKVIRQAKER